MSPTKKKEAPAQKKTPLTQSKQTQSKNATKSSTAIQKVVSSYNLRHKQTHMSSATRHDTQKPTLMKSKSVEYFCNKTQAVPGNKKKKQDEKLHKVQQRRKAQGKEKLENQRKLLQKVEQRAKEKFQLKQQEDLSKAAEQNRKEAEREQKQKKAQTKKALAERKMQENYLRIMAAKNSIKERLQLSELNAKKSEKEIQSKQTQSENATKSNTSMQKVVSSYNLRHKQTHMSSATRHGTQKPALMKSKSVEYFCNKGQAKEGEKENQFYDFDMLRSDDSTDDEETKPSSKKPPPPSWSLLQNRKPNIMMQAMISTEVINSFFSVAPVEVDLQQIFPNINKRRLRRNSSAVWNTPPRYSMLPKY